MAQTNGTTETVSQIPPPQNTTVEIAGDVYEALRTRAFLDRTSQKQIIDEALRKHLNVPAQPAA